MCVIYSKSPTEIPCQARLETPPFSISELGGCYRLTETIGLRQFEYRYDHPVTVFAATIEELRLIDRSH